MAARSHCIWIAPGCIHCYWCSNLAPAIFIPDTEGTTIASAMRVDGQRSDNRAEHSPLRADTIAPQELAFMPFIADGCPVHVIHLEGDWSELGVADPTLEILR